MKNNSRYTIEEIQFIKDNYIQMDYKTIGEKLGRTEGSIRAKCHDMNLIKKEPMWTQDELDFLQNNYMKMKTTDIANKLHRTNSAIQIKAKKMGLKKYPYTCDYNYFNKIDTEEKAYWLGFIAADGWSSYNKNNNAGVIGITLNYIDINHLKKFNKSINGNYKISDGWKSCSMSQSDKKNHYCTIRVYSVLMYESLKKIGLTDDKTFSIRIPSLPDELIRHFIRGFFDGDGCFSVSNNRLSVSFITASIQMKDDIIKSLIKYGIELKDYSYTNEFNTIMYRPEAVSNKEKIALLDYMYKDCNIYLDRKYKKYIKAKNIIDHYGLAV